MFKHVTRLFIIAGLLFLGCTLWWVNQDETSSPNEENDKRDPIQDIPFLPDLQDEPDENSTAQVKTFLLLGVNPGEPIGSEALALAQIEPNENDLKLVSLVNEEIIDAINKDALNWEDQLIEKVEEQFDLKIDHTISIDFEGFVSMIDQIVPEGIEVTLTEEMVEKMNIRLQPGTHSLRGQELLHYIQFQGHDAGDYSVLLAVKEAVKAELSGFDGMLKIPGLIEESKSHVETDMAFNELVSMVTSLVRTGVDRIEPLQAPFDDKSEEVIEVDAGATEDFNKTPTYLKNVDPEKSYYPTAQ